MVGTSHRAILFERENKKGQANKGLCLLWKQSRCLATCDLCGANVHVQALDSDKGYENGFHGDSVSSESPMHDEAAAF